MSWKHQNALNYVKHFNSVFRKPDVFVNSNGGIAIWYPRSSEYLTIDGKLLKRAKVSPINDHSFRMTLTEGRKRQIRRMCELVGLNVVSLKRTRIGKIHLGHLKEGEWRYLKKNELP